MSHLAITKTSHERLLRELPCVVSMRDTNNSLHHCHSGSMVDAGFIRGASQKTGWLLQIPLDFEFHLGVQNPEAIGVLTWESRWGTQIEHLQTISEWVQYDVLSLARYEQQL